MDRNLLLTAIDLTRACSAHEQYLEWLSLYEPVLHGSLGIAHYFGLAAEAFENAAARSRGFDELESRELLADELTASPPLTPEQLAAAAANAIAACHTCSANLPLHFLFATIVSHALPPGRRTPNSQENSCVFNLFLLSRSCCLPAF